MRIQIISCHLFNQLTHSLLKNNMNPPDYEGWRASLYHNTKLLLMNNRHVTARNQVRRTRSSFLENIRLHRSFEWHFTSSGKIASFVLLVLGFSYSKYLETVILLDKCFFHCSIYTSNDKTSNNFYSNTYKKCIKEHSIGSLILLIPKTTCSVVPYRIFCCITILKLKYIHHLTRK